ncbi:XdhC family protein [Paenibacillus sp. FSL L8-0436]|uniref:XdhC family protein n=1 Tax=Paenibacillus sp. FSL L8-0436 TaxID=2954686 RepID=UPI0031581618
MSTHDIVLHIHDNAAPAVLATLIGVEGHSYRKPGAAMLFFAGGTLGSLSPGCLESDLALRTQEVWDRGLPEPVEYDMLSPDDFSWGEAVGCGGKIKVILEPVRGELRRLLEEVYVRMAAGESLILTREAAAVAGYRYTVETFGAEQQSFSNQRSAGGSCLVKKGRSLLPGTTAAAGPPLELFNTLFVPKPRLIIFGGGLDSRPVADLAAKSGFRIAVADWREGSLQHEFPGAERVICSPSEAAARLRITREDYVLICSHQSQRDRQFLESLLPVSPRYIGIIGSKARIALLVEGLEPPASLHAPVGLSIGAEGPEEIAVSIVAEIIQIRRAGLHELPKGVESVESSRYLSGSRAEQTNGSIQGVTSAVARGVTRERRAQ